MSNNESKVLKKISTGWQKRAENEGFDYHLNQPPFPGVTVIDFKHLDVQMLIGNISLKKAQPRVNGEVTDHISKLARSIAAHGLKKAIVATVDTRSGQLMPLCHHRLFAYEENGEKEIPCYIVDIVPYLCKAQKRQISRSEIISDYTSVAGLNRIQYPSLDMTRVDVLRWLHDKDTFGQFKSQDQKHLIKEVNVFLKAALPEWKQNERTKVRQDFMDSKFPKKVRSLTARDIKTKHGISTKNKEEADLDLEAGTLKMVSGYHAIHPSFGVALKKLYSASLSYNNKSKSFEDVISDLKVHMIFLDNSGQATITPDSIKKKRNESKQILTNHNCHQNAKFAEKLLLMEIESVTPITEQKDDGCRIYKLYES